ncbi:MAG TPA: hypothetical protein VLZ89_09790, partial [Anaerolineales bacterium]|nr:hypothetical protein [Anaerolineales bacterium]
MRKQTPPDNDPLKSPAERALPWSLRDTWIGVGLLALVVAAGSAIRSSGGDSILYQTFGIVALELGLLIPVVVILWWRRVKWIELGFRRFEGRAMTLGCGLILAAYVVVIVNNTVLWIFHIPTQGAELIHRFATLKSPVGLVLAAVIIAP